MADSSCNKCQNQAWNKLFCIVGLTATITALVQSILQVFAIHFSVRVQDVPYVLFFILHTWITIAYMGYTIRLLYLVKYKRSCELSRLWWYAAVIVMIVNPSQTVWWLIHEDYIFASVAAIASCVYISNFILVCRIVVPAQRDCMTKHTNGPENVQLNPL